MNKEPLTLYVFRILVSIALVAVLYMLYWSSELTEEDLKTIHTDLMEIKEELNDQNRVPASPKAPLQSNTENKLTKFGTHMDPSLPNLLAEDPFYKETLPKMLGKDFKPSGTTHSATVGKPDNLHPFSNWSQVSYWIELCNSSVASTLFGKYETLSTEMAIKMEARKMKDSDNPEFWVHLRNNVFWHPLSPSLFSEDIALAPHFLKKHPVTAHDFKFYLDAIMNPNVQEPGATALRTYLGDIKEIEVIDDLTFIVRWKEEMVKEPNGKTVPKIKYIAKLLTGTLRPLASFVYQYFPDGKKIIEEDSNPNTYKTNSVWAQNFSRHWAKNIIISCGPWIFDGMSERQIKFRRNPDYFNPYAALIERMEIDFKNSPDNIWQDFKEGKVDTYIIQPSQLNELDTFLKSPSYKEQAAKGLAIKKLEYLDRSYTYIGWNEKRPFFNSSKMRRALTMAIDRKRIVQQNLNGMGELIHGTFFVHSDENDPSLESWPYDPDEARKILQEEGWYDIEGNGIISKKIDGKIVPFRFSLTYYVKNPTTKAICDYVSTALKEIGIDCKMNGVDTADLSAVFDDKNFDALCLAWALGTPPDEPKQLWYSSGATEKGSSNMIGFANKKIDQIITELQFTYDKQKRLELYHQFDRIMHTEQPYTFLYTPKSTFLYREYVQNVFIPAKRQDLIPGADVEQPESTIFWLKKGVRSQ